MTGGAAATTRAAPVTAEGMTVGTLHYMAPEQLESKEVDGRADIFSFGAVVHEMATGKRAFPGETQASIIAKILDHDPPPVSSLEPPGKLSPPLLDRLVATCLAKDREDRWQTMRDVCRELKWIKGGGGKQSTAEVAEAKGGAKTWKRRLAFSVAGLLAWAVTALVVWNLRPALPAPPVPVTVTVPLVELNVPASSCTPRLSRPVALAMLPVPVTARLPVPPGFTVSALTPLDT